MIRIARSSRWHRRAVAGYASEPLERRVLLSLSAAGLEFRANTFTGNDQQSPAVASDADGDFVIAWRSSGQDGSGDGVYAQRYNAAGAALGVEFRVNTATAGAQTAPAVAADADGDFVVVWQADGQDGGGYGIYAQRYDAAGVAQGGEFRVNATTAGHQRGPAVAMDAAGDFVVAWQSQNQDGDGYGVYAQRFDVAGAARGSEFRVNTFTADDQDVPQVAMDADGDFVVAWQSYGQDGSSDGVYAQRYDAAGAAQGGEFRVNTTTAGVQLGPSVAMDAGGDFVVAWTGVYDIFAQRYNAAGVAQGGETLVNTAAGTQSTPTAAMDAAGNFLVAWTDGPFFGDGQDGSRTGVYARNFNAAGVAQSGEFRVNTFTPLFQLAPSAAMDADGDAVVAWLSDNQNGSDDDVHAQRYDESNPDAAPPVVGDVFFDNQRVLPYATYNPTLTRLVVTFSENMTDAGGTTGANSVTNPANWLVTRNGVAVTASITYGFNPAANRFEAELSFSKPITDGNILLKARDNLRDVAGNRLDGDLSGAAGGALLLPFAVMIPARRGEEFRVNTTTALNQFGTAAAMDAAGNFVVAWGTNVAPNDVDVFAQRFDAAGTPLGGEFRVNTFTTPGDQAGPAVAMDADGDFVIAWTFISPPDRDIFARRYNAAGVAQGPEFVVTAPSSINPQNAAVAMDAGGAFVIAWEANSEGPSDDLDIFARRFSAGGAGSGEFLVNLSFDEENERSPSVAVDSSGDFVIVWEREVGYEGEVYARRYNAAGQAQGSEFFVGANTSDFSTAPQVAMDSGGDFVVAWVGQPAALPPSILARRYNAAGAAQGGEFRVSAGTAGVDVRPDVAMEPDGDFVVAWDGYEDSPYDYDTYARRYTAAGVELGGEFQVNTFTMGNQARPAVAVDATGDTVVTWNSYGQGDAFDVYAQRYGLRDAPTVATLADTPDPVVAGNSITVSASGAASADGTVTSVSFYRESNGDPGLQVGFQGDTLVGTSTTPVGGFFSASASTAGLADGTYTYWAQATDDVGLTGPPASTTNTVTGGVDATAPRVTAVFVDGTAWTAAFRQHLFAAGQGSATLGFRIDAGAAQLDELPWTNINRVRVVFSENVIVNAADLAVRGVNVAGYALNAAAFAYDAATFTATWALAGAAGAFAADKVLLDLDGDAPGGVADAAGNRLDGDWVNGTSAFPSGTGAAGGDFRFRLNILPGDVNRGGGIVNSLDVQQTRLRQFTSPDVPGTPPNTYSAFFDVNGSAGIINALDVQQVRLRQFSGLPDGNPAVLAASRLDRSAFRLSPWPSPRPRDWLTLLE